MISGYGALMVPRPKFMLYRCYGAPRARFIDLRTANAAAGIATVQRNMLL